MLQPALSPIWRKRPTTPNRKASATASPWAPPASPGKPGTPPPIRSKKPLRKSTPRRWWTRARSPWCHSRCSRTPPPPRCRMPCAPCPALPSAPVKAATPGRPPVHPPGFDAQGDTYLDGVRDTGGQSREIFDIESIEVSKGRTLRSAGVARPAATSTW